MVMKKQNLNYKLALAAVYNLVLLGFADHYKQAYGDEPCFSGASCRWFSGLFKDYDKQPSIVIGYDGRKNSDVFARDTAEIMAGAGVKAYLLPRKLPTPVLSLRNPIF